MKAATGELNLTVITIVAIGAVVFFFMTVLWPNIQKSINSSWDNMEKDSANPSKKTTPGMITGNGLFEFTSGDYTITVK